jgi:surfeit locus 1 family protein
MRTLLSPRWIIGHLLVLAICLACILLGFWQLDRLAQRRLNNEVQGARYAATPTPLHEALAATGGDVDSLEYRRITATGQYRPDEEFLVRSQVREGQAGFDVVTPLDTADGVILVDRGWVPLEFDTVPVTAAPPPEGTVTVEALARLSATRGPLGAIDDTGKRPDVVSRINVDLLSQYVDGDVVPFYLAIIGPTQSTALPVPADPPDFTDEGPHLNYAIQWFSFALIGIIGYGLLIRRAVRRESGGGEAIDDLDPVEVGQVPPSHPDLGGPGPGADDD